MITVGDLTDHGGKVITGDCTSVIDGKAMAREGDLTSCPKCKGIFPILRGNGIVQDSEGKLYARHLDRTACGAKLISSQAMGSAEDMDSPVSHMASGASDDPAAMSAIASPTDSGICLECLVKAAASGSALVVRS
jgi:uncharacterized Zn-binding protein involved in type VI secretion